MARLTSVQVSDSSSSSDDDETSLKDEQGGTLIARMACILTHLKVRNKKPKGLNLSLAAIKARRINQPPKKKLEQIRRAMKVLPQAPAMMRKMKRKLVLKIRELFGTCCTKRFRAPQRPCCVPGTSSTSASTTGVLISRNTSFSRYPAHTKLRVNQFLQKVLEVLALYISSQSKRRLLKLLQSLLDPDTTFYPIQATYTRTLTGYVV